jgi:hypothetical protein
MIRMCLVFASWVCIVPIVSLAGAPTTAPARSDLEHYRNDEFGFTFIPPPGWSRTAATADQHILVRFQSPPSATTPSAWALCYVQEFRIQAGTSTDALPEKYSSAFRRTHPEAEISKAKVTVGGEAAWRLEFQYKTKTGTAMKSSTTVLVHNDHQYVLVLSGDATGFDQFAPVADEVVRSWRWIPPVAPTTSPATRPQN